MHPRLLVTPLFTLHTFGALLAAAYLTALWWLMRGARRERLNADTLASLGMWAIAGAIIGAKTLLTIRSLPQGASEIWSLSLLTSAGDFYGGFFGGIVASALFFRLHPALAFWQVSDLGAPAIALWQSIRRIGCFMAGDDYRPPTQVPLAVHFTDPDAARLRGPTLRHLT